MREGTALVELILDNYLLAPTDTEEMKDLAKSVNMIGPSIVERIDQLQSAGLLVRSPVPEDRRASLVDLTDEGKAFIARLRGVMRATEDALTYGLDKHDVQTTRRVLAQVAERARTLRAERSG